MILIKRKVMSVSVMKKSRNIEVRASVVCSTGGQVKLKKKKNYAYGKVDA